jgi:cellulase/cellobiase CelA1
MHILTTTQQKLNRASKARPSQTPQAVYGICHKCQSFIEIPGLEAFKCGGSCGWVTRKAERATELHRPAQVIAVNIAPVYKSEVSLLDLVDQGGEA